MTVPVDYFLCKLFHHLLVSKIADKVVSLLLVNHAHMRSCLPELFGNAASYALCTTRNNGYFVLKIHHVISIAKDNSHFQIINRPVAAASGSCLYHFHHV